MFRIAVLLSVLSSAGPAVGNTCLAALLIEGAPATHVHAAAAQVEEGWVKISVAVTMTLVTAAPEAWEKPEQLLFARLKRSYRSENRRVQLDGVDYREEILWDVGSPCGTRRLVRTRWVPMDLSSGRLTMVGYSSWRDTQDLSDGPGPDEYIVEYAMVTRTALRKPHGAEETLLQATLEQSPDLWRLE